MPAIPFSDYTVLSAFALSLAIDCLFGDPPGSWHPVAWMGACIGWGRALVAQWMPLSMHRRRFWWGASIVLVGAALLTLPILALTWVARRIGPPLYVPLAALILKLTFTYSGLAQAVHDVRLALKSEDLDDARRLAAWHLVSRDTSGLDSDMVAAAAIESLAENTTDGFVAPLFYFGLAGLPGAWAYRFSNTCDSMLGYRTPELEYVGKFAARLDDVLNWLPARLAGLLMVVGAGLVGEDARGAWRTMWSQHARTSSPNAGWTMCAMAGALGVTLEKVGHYRLDGGDGPLSSTTLGRAMRVAQATVVIFSLLLAALLAPFGVLAYAF